MSSDSDKRSEITPATLAEPVAIIGMALKVPGAQDLGRFWDNLLEGKDCLSRPTRGELESAGVSQEAIADDSFVSAKPALDNVEYFDAEFFGISRAEAEQTDPGQRLFLECVLEAMEHAGVVPGSQEHLVGVFAGAEGDYGQRNLATSSAQPSHGDLPRRIGNMMDYVTLRVSHYLDLRGPSLASVATCATSLATVNNAVLNLRSGTCGVAIAGGVRLELAGDQGYSAKIDGMYSVVGRVRPFDANADGTVFGNGIGVVVMKLLKDAVADGDSIHAVIRGAGYSNDGAPADKKTFIAPAASGQKRAIRQALDECGVDARTIGYVECHGTATLLGDPIEVGSLHEVFETYTGDKNYCAIGSIKGNVGHLGSAAGVVSLIKTCLTLKNGVIPPVANFEAPNPKLSIDSSPFFVNSEPHEWKTNGEPRRAGVSAFGFGGANGHLILEEYRTKEGPNSQYTGDSTNDLHLLVLSARSKGALERRLTDLAIYFEQQSGPLLGDIAYSLQLGREAMPYRTSLVASEQLRANIPQALRALDISSTKKATSRPVVFLFPGQGAQYPGMGQGLYESEPVYRDIIDYCAEFLRKEIDLDLRDLIHRVDGVSEEEAKDALKQTSVAQPALFVVEYALSKLYRDHGLKPDAMLGHSLGELVAGCLAGVFFLDDALRIVSLRSRLVQACMTGSMAAVMLPASELEELLPSDIELAAFNYPGGCVVSGPTPSVERFLKILSDKSITNQALDTSHAFHSRMLDPAVKEFELELGKFSLQAPSERIISNVTGQPMTDEDACSASYWAKQVRQPVRFSEGLSHFLNEENPIFVEVGPGRTLSGFVARHDNERDAVTTLHSSTQDASLEARRSALEQVGNIWSLGADVLFSRGTAQKSPLPTYPLRPRFNWLDRRRKPDGVSHEYPLHLYETGWKKDEAAGDGNSEIDAKADWLVFADEHGVADRLVSKLQKLDGTVTVVTVGAAFKKLSERTYEMAPGSREQMAELLDQLPEVATDSRLQVLHFWTLTADTERRPYGAAFRDCVEPGFYTLLALVRTAGMKGFASRMDVQVFSDGVAQVDAGNDVNYPEKASLIGPCIVIPLETPGLTMRVIDIPGAIDSEFSETLWEELGKSSSTTTALRNDGRYVEGLFELSDLSRGLPRLRRGGTVLITGGVGGIALELAEFLYDTLKVKLVLTSRWELPSNEERRELEQQENKVGRALRVISRLTAKGADVLVVRADAGSLEDMKIVVEKTEQRFGAIHGVMHAAGRVETSPAFDKTREDAEKVFAAKVASAYVLEELFENKHLDVMLYFSSVASTKPSRGQVDYTSANALLDNLARRRQATGRGLACAIGWAAWRDTGMAWDHMKTRLGTSSFFHRKLGVPLKSGLTNPRHPLLSERRTYIDGDTLFSGSFTKGKDWVATEHIVNRRAVISGTTMWEMLRAGFAELFPEAQGIELTKLAIYERFLVEDTSEFELLYLKMDSSFQMELRSRVSPESAWIVNTQGTVREVAAKKTVAPTVAAKLLELEGRELNAPIALEHEGRWGCKWAVEKYDRGVVSKLQLQDRYHGEEADYGAHPALYDRAIHHLLEEISTRKLPYTCEVMRFYAPLGTEVLTYGWQSDAKSADGFDFVMMNKEGQLLVEMAGYVTRELADDLKEAWLETSGPQARKAMVLQRKGSLDSFQYLPAERHELGPDSVRIVVRAAALNFRDVLCALGQMPSNDASRDRIGSECSGVVSEIGENIKHLKVGDRVLAIADNCYTTDLVAEGHSVAVLPQNISFTDGAGIPITFLTVHHALNELARLKKGEKILIHAAAGGIGLAAVQMAQFIGAEVFATAGSDAKRDYLHSIGIEHVMDSRSLDFVEEVNRKTDGAGVDVVLNALAGDYIPASMSLLKPFGRFLEIGKKDIYGDTQIGLYPFRNNLSYFGVDLGQYGTHRPADLQRMFSALMRRFATGELTPSPTKVYPLKDIGDGFQFVALARHIGKVVFLVQGATDKAEVAEERFSIQLGEGITVKKGLSTIARVLASDETPPYVLALGDALTSSRKSERYLSEDHTTSRPIDTKYRAPRTANEERLKQIWENTLGFSPIGIDDDFVELGGDSINAIMIQAAMERAFGLDLPFSVLFRHPTIVEIAELIDEQTDSTA